MDFAHRLTNLLIFYPVFLFSLSCHEAAHGWMASRFGDQTARYMGRVTISPLPHMDIIGTVILPCFGILSGLPVIGWGRPVPINPRNFTDVRKGTLWVSASGPITNILLAVLFALLSHLFVYFLSSVDISQDLLIQSGFGLTVIKFFFGVFQIGVVLNLVLAFFNLIPIPPLDGSGIIQGILPYGLLARYHDFTRYGMIILILLLATGMLRYLLTPAYFFADILLP